MSDDRSEEIAVRRKRLRFRCQRRGFREVDLIFGAFASAYLAELPVTELDQLEALLDVPDQEVFLWLQGHKAPSAGHDNEVLAKLKAICRRTSPTWNV